MLTKHKFSAVGAAVAALSGLAFTSAQAQDTQRIEVTGSRILSPNALSPAPIQVLTSADIAASGAVNLQDLILKSPVFGTPGISRTNSNFITSSVGVATVDLRNLGSDRTLVLVNGRRYVAGISGSATVDLNTIPTDFIERVEVLTGGAAPRRFVWNPTPTIAGRSRARWACGQAAFGPVHMSTGRLFNGSGVRS